MMGKVFCIGFHKTGTTSLGSALSRLGYRVTGPNGVHDPNIATNVYVMARKLVQKYDAFQDNPWPVIFREMDAEWPGSKFILTWRDPEKWIRSQVEHFGSQCTPMREWIYGVGCPKGNEDIYVQRYERHNVDVIEYFRDRPSDLLVLDIDKNELNWERICDFLGLEIPDASFPVKNTASGRTKNKVRDQTLMWTITRMFVKRNG